MNNNIYVTYGYIRQVYNKIFLFSSFILVHGSSTTCLSSLLNLETSHGCHDIFHDDIEIVF